MSTGDLSKVALFAALSAAGAFVKIPLWPVPLTLQTFFVLLSGLMLGPRLGSLSQAVYVVLGLAGLPVFTNGGGLGYLFQPTFGYLVGFVVAAAVAGWVAGPERPGLSWRRALCASALGSLAVYCVGVPYLYVAVRFFAGKALPWLSAVKTGFLVFVPGDVLKAVMVAIIAPRVVRLTR